MKNIVEADLEDKLLIVKQRPIAGTYDVFVGKICKHHNLNAEDVIRILGQYINSLSYKLISPTPKH